MTDLLVPDFSVGTAGNPVTVAEVPFFTSKVGTVIYAAIGDGRMGMLPNSAGAGQMFRSSMDGRAKYGFRWKKKFQSSTATTAYFLGLCLRNGATIRSDVGLRNAAGSRHAAFRNNFIYVGEATGNTMAAGEIWSFETVVETSGGVTTQVVRVWESDINFDAALPAPTYTWGIPPVTLAVAPDNFFFGADVNTGVSAIIFDVRFTDGESVTPPAPGTLTFLSNVFASQTEAVFVGKVAGALEVSVVTAAGTVDATPDAAGYFRVVATGLTPGAATAWDIQVDGVSRRTGTITTLPSGIDGHSFLWGSCFDSNASGFFALATARDPDIIIGVGDHGYFYLNGVLASDDVAVVRSTREPVLTAAAPQALFTGFPYSYTYSDCDGAGANSDSTWVGFTSGAVQAAYRQQFAHPTLPLVDCGARSWVVGTGEYQVRFIQTDELTLASPKGDAQGAPGKSKLGATQKTWFKAQIDAAAIAGQSVVWFGDGPWITPAALGSNEWAAYDAERTELGAYIAASGVKLIRLHGDSHTLFADNGTNNPWGGFPTASAAPWHTQANPYGPTVSNGKWPTAQEPSSRQYGMGLFAVADDTLTLTIRGYSSTISAPTEVQRFLMSVDMTPGAEEYVFIEWNGTVETPLTAIEWNGTTETVLTPIEQA